MRELLDLSGRVAIVTGASRGIGLAIAKMLAHHGATLILNARHDDLQVSRAVTCSCRANVVPGTGASGGVRPLAFTDPPVDVAAAVHDPASEAEAGRSFAEMSPVPECGDGCP